VNIGVHPSKVVINKLKLDKDRLSLIVRKSRARTAAKETKISEVKLDS